jgi:radical SAM superfamily enzyme YgiQ (UPF0313 family)
MKVALVGAELEENLGLRYMSSALHAGGHEAEIVPFNARDDIAQAVERVSQFEPGIVGLSMVFTGRAREFCQLALALRDSGYCGHIIAGGHFACFNAERLLRDFPFIDSVGLGEGEEIIVSLADHLPDYSQVQGLCFRRPYGTVQTNPSKGNPDNLDLLAFPKRSHYHRYFDKPIASLLTSRGCWRDCAFCSINAWYKKGGGRKFRIRSAENVIAEMKQLYHEDGVRIFNMQDDNFFLPRPEDALRRFEALRAGLEKEGVRNIAIAVKARPDSITYEAVRVLDDLGLFRVFLGVENASENALRNLNRKCSIDQIRTALQILNDFDVHVAYNMLMFEPDTTMDDIRVNLRFLERNVENPLNFCRAEAYAGTGLESKLMARGELLGDYFGYDYRLSDPHCEAFHQISNFAFFDRNFNDNGLHYFNMQVDFYFQLLRRFYPQVITQTLRSSVRNFIKRTNLDTYAHLCEVHDWIVASDPRDQVAIRGFAREMRRRVDSSGEVLRDEGERVLAALTRAFDRFVGGETSARRPAPVIPFPFVGGRPIPYLGLDRLADADQSAWELGSGMDANFGVLPSPVPYGEFVAGETGRGTKGS